MTIWGRTQFDLRIFFRSSVGSTTNESTSLHDNGQILYGKCGEIYIYISAMDIHGWMPIGFCAWSSGYVVHLSRITRALPKLRHPLTSLLLWLNVTWRLKISEEKITTFGWWRRVWLRPILLLCLFFVEICFFCISGRPNLPSLKLT